MDDDALAYLAIMRLQGAYADIASRRAWSEFAPLATPDARFTFNTHSGNVFEVVGAEAFGEFGAKMTGGFSFYEYIPLNAVVTIGAAGTATGRAYSLEVAEDRDTGEWINFYGFYYDDYKQFDGGWRFAHRRYQTLARRVDDRLEVYPVNDQPR
jgi:SnoaL-like domain